MQAQAIEITGATVRNRTADIFITSEVLYQLSYGGFGLEIREYNTFLMTCL